MLRIVCREDMAAIRDIYAPFITDNAVSFELDVPTEAELWRRAQALLPHTPWLVEEQEGVVAGYAYASPHRDRAAYQWTREVSVYVHPDFYRRQTATRLYSALFDLLRLQGFANLLAGITQPNPRSIAFHERMGFTLVGVYRQIGFKFGRYHDVGWWELPLRREDEPPPAWIPFERLRQGEEVEDILKRWSSYKI